MIGNMVALNLFDLITLRSCLVPTLLALKAMELSQPRLRRFNYWTTNTMDFWKNKRKIQNDN